MDFEARKIVAQKRLKTRVCNKMAFVIIVCFCLVNVTSGQETPIEVVLGRFHMRILLTDSINAI